MLKRKKIQAYLNSDPTTQNIVPETDFDVTEPDPILLNNRILSLAFQKPDPQPWLGLNII